MALIAGLAAPPLGAWIDMRLAVVRLEDRSADIDRRLERIERSVYGEAKLGAMDDDLDAGVAP